MSYLPKEPKDPKKVSPARIALWVAVAAVGGYMVITGIIQVIQHGS
ncbi:hypothetical protein BH10ACT6_BH10ACT6_07310 [soil metagenome]